MFSQPRCTPQLGGLLVCASLSVGFCSAEQPAAATPKSFAELEEFQSHLRELSAEADDTPDSKLDAANARLAASERYLAELASAGDGDADFATRYAVLQIKLKTLQQLIELKDASAPQRLAEALREVRADPSPQIETAAWRFEVGQKIQGWSDLDEQQALRLIDEIASGFNQREPTRGQILFIARQLYSLDPRMPGNDDPKLVDPRYRARLVSKIKPTIPKSSPDAATQQVIEFFQQICTRLELPGKKLELTGKLLDGAELNWPSYRGRVVLVDFWALWCKNCYATVPEIKRLHDAHHDEGFDVLFVSFDDNAEDAKAYMKQTGIEGWPTVIGETPETSGFEHPYAKEFGIDGLPFTILVDRNGVAARVNLKGEALNEEVRRLLEFKPGQER